MQDLTLVILAAGMGSRFGEKKQLVGFGPAGQLLPEYSMYDAVKAGFSRVIWIIQEADQEAFNEALGHSDWQVPQEFAYQDLQAVPEFVTIPSDRVKPWGTAHALLSTFDLIDGPFAVINCDDYYGPSAYEKLAEFLRNNNDSNKALLLAYELGKTLSDNGSVTRAVLKIEDGDLKKIVESEGLHRENSKILDQCGQEYREDTPVSMNSWAFTKDIMPKLRSLEADFFRQEMPNNPLKSEFYIPTAVAKLMLAGEIEVKVLPCSEQWFGVTNREDSEKLEQELLNCHKKGLYPDKF